MTTPLVFKDTVHLTKPMGKNKQFSGSTPLSSETLTRREDRDPSADDSNPDSFGPKGVARGTYLRLNN